VIDTTGLAGFYDFTLRWGAAAGSFVPFGLPPGLNLPGMDTEVASMLAEKGVTTRDALADLAVDELVELTGMAEDSSKDLFEFFQKMWNPTSFPLPGVFTPTMSVEEVEKKIAELSAVENWLKMNLTFLQMTIKTLEMQKAALEALGAGQDKKAP